MSARAVGATSLTQQSENFGYSAVRLRRIVKLQFGIINPTDLVRSFLLEIAHEADGVVLLLHHDVSLSSIGNLISHLFISIYWTTASV